jgi:hypothetical protein
MVRVEKICSVFLYTLTSSFISDFASIEALSSRKSDKKAKMLLKKLKTEKLIPHEESENNLKK